MPDPSKKISTPSQDSPCEIKLACAGGAKDKTCDKIIKIEKTQKKVKTCKSAEEKQATLNKKPCPLGVSCQIARPEQTTDPAARIDNEKPGCINFESCEGEEDDDKPETGCLDFEDCDDYLREEKKRAKKVKAERKQRRKEEMAKARAREAEREEKS